MKEDTTKAPVFETDARIDAFEVPRWGSRAAAQSPSRCGSAAEIMLISSSNNRSVKDTKSTSTNTGAGKRW